MSHRKQRTDTNCLNCGSIVAGKYCQNCGQENIELKETFFQIILHFIEDLTHFDGKIVKTLKFLITKPAFLSKEYMQGKRVTYIHPIRMYIFISAVFFLFIFSGDTNNEPLKINNSANQANSGIVFGDSTYKTIPAYEIAQKSLPIDKRDSWLETKLKKQQILINQKYGNDQRKINAALIDNFKHNFSKILYLSLPIFAFFLWVLYKRNRSYYFADHIIFSIHLYCAYFIIIFFFSLVQRVLQFFIDGDLDVFDAVLFIVLLLYFYKAMRNFYNQTRSKTVLKFFVINALNLVSFMGLFLVLILLSLFNI